MSVERVRDAAKLRYMADRQLYVGLNAAGALAALPCARRTLAALVRMAQNSLVTGACEISAHAPQV